MNCNICDGPVGYEGYGGYTCGNSEQNTCHDCVQNYLRSTTHPYPPCIGSLLDPPCTCGRLFTREEYVRFNVVMPVFEPVVTDLKVPDVPLLPWDDYTETQKNHIYEIVGKWVTHHAMGRQCPGCGHYYLKDGNCTHIKCPYCSLAWCYCCRGIIAQTPEMYRRYQKRYKRWERAGRVGPEPHRPALLINDEAMREVNVSDAFVEPGFHNRNYDTIDDDHMFNMTYALFGHQSFMIADPRERLCPFLISMYRPSPREELMLRIFGVYPTSEECATQQFQHGVLVTGMMRLFCDWACNGSGTNSTQQRHAMNAIYIATAKFRHIRLERSELPDVCGWITFGIALIRVCR